MVVETEVIPYLRWLLTDCGDGQSALRHFGVTVLVLIALVSLVCSIVATFRYGPTRGLRVVGRALKAGVVDLVRISPRRVLGLSMLAVREAFRRYIWVALVVFLVILMFAGWSLNPGSREPAKLYLSFVLTCTTYLMLFLALYLSSLSLPADIKNRTIYTIVTKPVRASEIVLGRILGFSFVCTVLLGVMAIASYLFVSRALAHTHEVDAAAVTPVKRNQQVVRYSGMTSIAGRHQHKFNIAANSFSPGVELAPAAQGLAILRVTAAARAAGANPGDMVTAIDSTSVGTIDAAEANLRLLGAAGSEVKLTLSTGGKSREITLTRDTAQGQTELEKGHWHRVVARWDKGTIRYEIGPAEGTLTARVPVYGTLRFRDPQGDPKDPGSWTYKKRGISVGKLFDYRSYIDGNSLAAAIWTFEGLREADYPNGLPLDVDIRVYRGHKGKIDEPITGSIELINPEHPERSCREIIFSAKEYTLDRINIPRQLTDAKGKPLDLFRDLVSSTGDLDVMVRCVPPGQYFGMARADVYVRAADGSYTLNFFKTFAEVWLQVVLVTSLAVLFSTFLSGPVAALLTVTTILMGFYSKRILALTNSVIYRAELQAVEGLRERGMKLDEAGMAFVQKLKDSGSKDFSQLSMVKLHAVQSLGLDKVSVLDRVYGGGPIEAFYRIITQRNLISDLEPGTTTNVIQSIDSALMHGMQYVLHVLPDFRRFADTDYLAAGYNIPTDLVLQHATVSLAFCGAAFVAGYFVLKYREVAR